MRDHIKHIAELTPRIQQHIAARMRARRQELDIKQIEVADTTGLTVLQIQKYEKGSTKIPSDKLYIISQLFDVDVNYFYEGLYQEEGSKSLLNMIKFANPHKQRLFKRDLLKTFGNADIDNLEEHIEDFLIKINKKPLTRPL